MTVKGGKWSEDKKEFREGSEIDSGHYFYVNAGEHLHTSFAFHRVIEENISTGSRARNTAVATSVCTTISGLHPFSVISLLFSSQFLFT